jgi:hypothetical protein
LFAFDWNNPHRNTDGKYFPTDSNVQQDSRCNSSTKSTVTEDESSLQDSFSNNVWMEASGSGWGFDASFSASTSYNEQKTEMQNGK